MTREQKAESIEQLKQKFAQHEFFYVADSSDLTVEQVNKFRGLCFAKGIEMQMVKNTLAIKALEQASADKGYAGIIEAFKGTSAVLFTPVSNAPAKVIQEFRKEFPKPVLKAAYIDSAVYIGDDQLEALTTLKSKEELIGELIGLLQSPIINLMSALQSGGNTISGILKTLEGKGE
ncbi:MAG TPA: 50S ribosomal protein L10 [Saprospiraceae bacterium]|nr:50S ribosomal protein L10 [Saprospiraceae bacterium]